MPATVGADAPSVSLSFANNFWGKDDAGVSPLLERMHNAKVTGDELKAFYTARAAIEDEYSRKLLSLSRKPLGSSEAGTLRMSLDVVRGEIESMGKAHQNIAQQMKTELEEPLAAFAGGLKERRKIVQGGIEKLLKVKTQQTIAVNKARDRYEQDCLKIKGFLAQAHMVMGQEERKNKAKLEKTQIQLSSTSSEYEAAVKILEETTGRWNRDWKAACDKFQDLEEERIDFMKSSLWTFANLASTVCVSDDASCEKIRLSLEDCDVEKDICGFIKENGTGQEIPDPPKYINFCRGDVDDHASEASDEGYSVAQFQRTLNPAFRSSSPQPSVYESHHDPANPLGKEFGFKEPAPAPEPVAQSPVNPQHPQRARPESRAAATAQQIPYSGSQQQHPRQHYQDSRPSHSIQQQINQGQYGDIPKIPYNEHPMDGMTQFCRGGGRPGTSSERSYVMVDMPRPSSSGSQSECSNGNSFSSIEPPSGSVSPVKQMAAQAPAPAAAPAPAPAPAPVSAPAPAPAPAPLDDRSIQKKKSGFFQNHSPFRRKSRHEKEHPAIMTPGNRNTWAPSKSSSENTSPVRKTPFARNNTFGAEKSASPEPVDPRANFQLNIGGNVFDVASPDSRKKSKPQTETEDMDPIAQALAELKGVSKQASVRVSADRYHGISTPVPPSTSGSSVAGSSSTPVGGVPTPLSNATLSGAKRGTPPPSYDQPVSRLGAPQPAFTAKQMQQTTQKYIDQKQNMFNSSSRPPTRGSNGPGMAPRAASPAPPRGTNAAPRATSPAPPRGGSSHGTIHRTGASSPATPRGTSGYGAVPRNASPAPPRATSPRPDMYNPASPQSFRAASPNPYATNSARNRAYSANPVKSPYGTYSRGDSPSSPAMQRAVSPQPQFAQPQRPSSSRGSDMAIQLAPAPSESGSVYGGSQRGRGGSDTRPMNNYYGHPGQRSGSDVGIPGGYPGGGQVSTRVRSKSVAEPRQYTRDGRPILHYSRAMYNYTAQIPEELSFAKGEILAVLRLQDDGWWEAEVVGKNSRPGLVPSNYLQNC